VSRAVFIKKATILVRTLLEEEAQLIGILKKRGAADPSISESILKISKFVVFPPATPGAARAFWQDHRQEVTAALESTSVVLITIPKLTENQAGSEADQAKLAKDLHKRLTGGGDFAELLEAHSSDGVTSGQGDYVRGDLNEALDAAAFSLQPGEISEVIGIENAYIILKVDERRPGKADDFEDPRVQKAAGDLLAEKRRKEWEDEYLKILLKRIAEEKR
jgi:parvulin-like peptidyl-prolyl isomerase